MDNTEPNNNQEQEPTAEEHEEEIPQAEIEEFLLHLKELGDEKNVIIAQVEAARLLLDQSIEMVQLGPNGPTPLAEMWHQPVVPSCLLSVMMSPNYSDHEKVEVISAIVITALRKYEILIN